MKCDTLTLRQGSTRLKITWVQQRQHHRAQESARERVLRLALIKKDFVLKTSGSRLYWLMINYIVQCWFDSSRQLQKKRIFEADVARKTEGRTCLMKKTKKRTTGMTTTILEWQFRPGSREVNPYFSAWSESLLEQQHALRKSCWQSLCGTPW